MSTCNWCGFDFNPGTGTHGCAESRMKPDLIQRLRETTATPSNVSTVSCPISIRAPEIFRIFVLACWIGGKHDGR